GQGRADQPRRGRGARRAGTLRGIRGAGAAPAGGDAAVLAAGPRPGARHAAVAPRIPPAGSEPGHPAWPEGARDRAAARGQRGGGALSAPSPGGGAAVIQVLVSIAAHSVALLIYPGLVAMVAFGT